MRAELLRAKGKLSDAIEAYRMALGGADDDAYLLSRLASAWTEAGDLEHAERLLSEALGTHPEAESVWLARAELCERRADLDGALIALEHAEAAAPHSARAPMRLAGLLREHGDPERARAVLERFRSRSLPGGAAAQSVELERTLASGDPAAVFAATLPYRLGAPPQPERPLLRAAELLFERGQPALAERLLELVPEPRRDVRLELALLLAVGSTAALEAWLEQHEGVSQDEPELAARAALRLGKLDEAALIVEAARMSDAASPSLQLMAAEVALARARYGEAADLFARIPAGSSAAAAARIGLARALGALGRAALASEVGQAAPASEGGAQ
jgi:thioredoxin-like negative regulator of GroEL